MTDRTFTVRFNRGEADRKAIARQDVERIKDSASFIENWWPIRLGPMVTRPGTGHLGALPSRSYFIPFIAATEDTASLEFAGGAMRVWVNDTPIVYPAVSTLVADPNFNSAVGVSWLNASEAGTTATISGGLAQLRGNGGAQASIYQLVTNLSVGVEHPLSIKVTRGKLILTLGTTLGGAEIYRGTLEQGTHSLSFTPAGNFYITLSSSVNYLTQVDFVTLPTVSAQLSLPTGIVEASQPLIRYAQSADVVYIASDKGTSLKRIERRGIRSWSVVDYLTEDGPFEGINISNVNLKPSALTGEITVDASRPYFTSGMAGSLVKIASDRQNSSITVTADDVETGSIYVTGSGAARNITVSIVDISAVPPFVGTIQLQRSFDNINFSNVQAYTTQQVVGYNDTLTDVALYYRLRVEVGGYTSGTFTITISYASGSITGIARLVTFNSATQYSAIVLKPFGDTAYTNNWYPGSWSPALGYPTSVALHEGRLFWAGQNRVWGSVSDSFNSFSREIEGNSASILRTIGFGPVDTISWLFPASRLLLGIASNELSVTSTSFGEALTPFNANIRKGSNQGVAKVDVTEADNKIYFVQRSLRKLYEIDYSGDTDRYPTADLTIIVPSIMSSDIVRLAVSRQPETRVFVVLADGTARVFLHEKSEDVRAWSRLSLTGALIEDVHVLPGLIEDRVYLAINRAGVRSLVRMAMQSEAIGGSTSRHFDSAIYYTSPGVTLTGLSHLEGLTVGVWADGQDRGTFVVVGGAVTLPAAYVSVSVGVRFVANWISNKLTDYIDGSVLTQNKRVTRIGMVLENVAANALTYGSDPSHLNPLPDVENGVLVSASATRDTYDELPFPFDGTYDTDSRIYLRAIGPVTALAITIEVDDPNYSPK